MDRPHGSNPVGLFSQKITTTLSGGREFCGIPAGQFYLSDFSNAKTILKYLTISNACYATVSSLGLTAKIPYFLIPPKAYRIRTEAVSTI